MNVFLTGATGHLGGELLIELARHPAVRRISCLVRPRRGQSGMDRIAQVFAWRRDPLDVEKVRCIEGDLTDAELGGRLGESSDLRDVELVIHCAAETSFSPFKAELIRRINVDGTQRLLAWAAALTRLDTFVYVSTAAICGAGRSGLLHEDDSPDAGARHLTRYTESKVLAEASVLRQLPARKVMIVRPSILLGDSQGRTPRAVDVHWVVAVVDRLRLLPVNPDLPLDMVPADYAAHAIIALALGQRQHRVYHVSAGVGAATSARQIAELLAQHNPEMPRFEFVEPSLRAELSRWITGPRNLTERLQPYVEYLALWRGLHPDRRELFAVYAAAAMYFEYMQLGQVFDNGRLMTDRRLPAPPLVRQYLAPILGYIRQIDVVAGSGD